MSLEEPAFDNPSHQVHPGLWELLPGGGKVGQEDVQILTYLGKGVPPQLFSDVF